jgi:hypothetical protein
MAKLSTSNYDAEVFLSGYKLFGVTDVNFGYSLPVEHLNVIGYNKFKTFTSGPPQSSLSIQKYLSPNDFLTGFTGTAGVSGGLFYSSRNRNFGFASGYLNSYSVSCSVGNFPTLNADFTIFGNVGTGLIEATANQTGTLAVVRPADILIRCDGSGTNRIESFTYSVECNRQAFYHPTGKNGPMDVVTLRPYRVTAQFSLGIDDYESKRLFDYIVDSNKNTINITVGSLATFTMSNMELVEETINTTATDDTVMTLNYVGYL